MLEDKNSVHQVLGGLMQEPSLLSRVDEYSLTIADFHSRFEKYVFAAICGLYEDGAKNIQPIDVENYLSTNDTAKVNFKNNNGVEYLQDVLELTDVQNFPYYYKRLKKINLLRDLKKSGFDTSAFYCEDLALPQAEQINSKFEELSIQEITEAIKRKVLKLESEYSVTGDVESLAMSDNIDDFLEDLVEEVDIGLPVQGEIYNKIISGAVPKTLTIRSGSSGLGKALPNHVFLRTTKGKKRVGEVKVGDYLYDAHGKPTKVLGVYPQGQKEMFQILFESGRTAKCSIDHLWGVVSNRQPLTDLKARKFQTRTLKEIIHDMRQKGEIFYVPRNEPIEGTRLIEEGEDVEWIMKWARSFKDSIHPIPFNDDILNLRPRARFRLLLEALRIVGAKRKKGKIVFHFKGYSAGFGLKEICFSLGLSAHWEPNPFTNDNVFTISGLSALIGNHKNATVEELVGYDKIKTIVSLGVVEEMTCFYVDNDEHLFLTEDYVVTHNTRQAVGDACYLAYPIRYDTYKEKWVQDGSNEKTLFIMTEQSTKEVRRMVMAYLTGINERKFRYNNFTKEERQRIEIAKKIIKKYNNLFLVKCPNPTIELVKTLVRENVITHDIKYVFYDYIFISPSLLGEFKGFALRNDEILSMFAAALKDLANELDVACFTSTQVNAKADDNTQIRGEGTLAGGRATINKADNGCICARPTKAELDVLADVTSTYGVPNMVTDIFKVRNGEWTQVRIWSILDLSIMRKKDLFITDERLNPIEGFYETPNYKITNFEDKEESELEKAVNEFNEL
jgi:replicative DNA helicase